MAEYRTNHTLKSWPVQEGLSQSPETDEHNMISWKGKWQTDEAYK